MLLEKFFLWIVFTVSTNFFFILIIPTFLFLPFFFSWFLPSPYRWIVIGVIVPPAAFFIWMVLTRMDPVLKWIHETGESGEIVFSQTYHSGNTINDQPEMMFSGTLKTKSGDLHEFEISTGGVLSYPRDPTFFMAVQQVYPVKYRPTYPHFWVVDRGSQESVLHRNLCLQLSAEIQRVQSLLLLKPEDPELKLKMDDLKKKLKDQKCDEKI